MKISLLLEREDFKKIFEKTLEGFLLDLFKKKHSVSWGNKKYDYSQNEKCQIWFCNQLINSIFVDGVDQRVFDPIIGEYAFNPLKPWKTPFQKLYLYLLKNNKISLLLSQYTININPPIKNPQSKLIIGGNTKIRILDQRKEKVYVILKKGFSKKYLERECYVRESFPFITVPKIHTSNKNSFWYCEEYITGLSPDRMGKKGEEILKDSIKMIHNLINKTNKEENHNTYLELIKNRILNRLKSIEHFNKDLKKRIISILEILLNHLELSDNASFSLSYCHGDFQQGNIIFDGEKTWILDWEYSGFKQPGYDIFVLLLQSRVPKMLTKNFLRFYDGDTSKKENLMLKQWPKIKWSNGYKHFHLILFLVEELDLHIEDNSNVRFYNPSTGLLNYIESVDIIIKLI